MIHDGCFVSFASGNFAAFIWNWTYFSIVFHIQWDYQRLTARYILNAFLFTRSKHYRQNWSTDELACPYEQFLITYRAFFDVCSLLGWNPYRYMHGCVWKNCSENELLSAHFAQSSVHTCPLIGPLQCCKRRCFETDLFPPLSCPSHNLSWNIASFICLRAGKSAYGLPPSAGRRFAPKIESSKEMCILHTSYFSSIAEIEIVNKVVYIIKLNRPRKKNNLRYSCFIHHLRTKAS